jgi:hypothetical protein
VSDTVDSKGIMDFYVSWSVLRKSGEKIQKVFETDPIPIPRENLADPVTEGVFLESNCY